MFDILNKTPQNYRKYILDMLIVTLGSWQAAGCEDEALEGKITFLLSQIHPKREVALLALQMHISQEVAV